VPLVSSGPGDSLLLGFVVAQSPAAVPDLIRCMTRREITEKTASLRRAANWVAWPCIFVSLFAAVAWTLNRSPREDVTLAFLAVIVTPVAVCLVVLTFLPRRAGLVCSHCHRSLLKHRTQQFVFETRSCPYCKASILDDETR
jgi:predicted permease